MSQITLLLVDDHPVFRGGLRDMIETDPTMKVIGEAANAEVAIEKATELQPDVMLIDVNLPTDSGLQATVKLRKLLPSTKFIIITGYDDIDQVYHAVRAGASAYCAKDAPPDDLLQTIRQVHNGFYVVHNRVMNEQEVREWMIAKLGPDFDPFDGDIEDMFIPLSPRETEILSHITKGLSNKEIAYKLDISHQTVKNHVTSILRKLRVDDRTQAAIHALQRGWFEFETVRN